MAEQRRRGSESSGPELEWYPPNNNRSTVQKPVQMVQLVNQVKKQLVFFQFHLIWISGLNLIFMALPDLT